jgi:lipopolysaccharide exporter
MGGLELKQEASLGQGSLARKVLQGGFWVIAIRLAGGAFSFVRLLVLARLLAPSDFGMLGLALLALSIFSTASFLGFQAALIQKKENVDPYLNTAWTIEMLRSFLLFFLVFLAAPLIADFFKNPEAARLIRVLAFLFILRGASNIGIIRFNKELEFHKQFLFSFLSSLTDMAVAIICAFLLRNAWALVFGVLAGNIASLALSYALCPYRPKWELDLKKARELFSFGRWVWGSTALSFLTTNGDDILVGRMLGTAALGFYQMAYRLSNTPATEITQVISQVTFPAYSKFQDNLPRVRESFLRVLGHTAFLAFPLSALIFVLAGDFTRVFLGAKWLPVVLPTQVLVAAGLMRALVATAGPVYYAMGKPNTDTRWQMARFMALAVFIYPCTLRWGLAGASVAVLISTLVITLGLGKELTKMIEYRFSGLMKTLFFPFLSSLAAAGAVSACKLIFGASGPWELFALGAIGMVAVLGSSYLFEKLFHYKELVLVRDLLRHLKKREGVE